MALFNQGEYVLYMGDVYQVVDVRYDEDEKEYEYYLSGLHQWILERFLDKA